MTKRSQTSKNGCAFRDDVRRELGHGIQAPEKPTRRTAFGIVTIVHDSRSFETHNEGLTMGTVRWLLTGFILLASPLIGHSVPPRHSLADIRCEICAPLFSGATDTSVRAALMQTGAAGRKAPRSRRSIRSCSRGWGSSTPGISRREILPHERGAPLAYIRAFEIYGNSVRDDARLYAVSNAGVSPAGKNDQFYVDVGNFLNVADYNEQKAA